jgi:hypothetical protein
VTRTHHAGIQWPLLSVGVALMAGVVGITVFTYQEYQIWTPLQRWYFNEYSLAHDFPHSGVTCHSSAAAKQRFSNLNLDPDLFGTPAARVRRPQKPEPGYP